MKIFTGFVLEAVPGTAQLTYHNLNPIVAEVCGREAFF